MYCELIISRSSKGLVMLWLWQNINYNGKFTFLLSFCRIHLTYEFDIGTISEIVSRKMMDLLTITLRSHLVNNKYLNKEKNFQQFGMRVINSFALFRLTATETTSNTSLNLMTSMSETLHDNNATFLCAHYFTISRSNLTHFYTHFIL